MCYFADQACIIRQGDEADAFYFVQSGVVQVAIYDHGSGREVVVTDLHKGAYFGELALITQKARAASVYAVGPVTCASEFAAESVE